MSAIDVAGPEACFGGQDGEILSRTKTKIHAKVPKPNRNVTMTYGHKTVVDAVFNNLGLYRSRGRSRTHSGT